MSTFTCPICEHSAIGQIHYINEFNVQCCKRCGHGITLPSLTDHELNSLYNEDYFDDQYEFSKPGDKDFTKRIKQEDNRYKAIERYLKAGKILDVGCGYGLFLFASKKMSNGQMTPYGFDVSSSNKSYIENQLAIPLFTDEHELTRYVQEKGSMNAITFWHSLEHFKNPKKTLHYFLSLLEKGGIIAIDVPMHDTIDAFAGRSDWEGWQVPFHQHHFTASSMKRLLRDVGLETLSTNTYKSGYIFKKLRKTPLKVAARYIAKLFRGGSMVTVCRKP